jgi:Family of unknown function (DUF5681)
MANPNPNTQHLMTSKWQAAKSGNPAGKPKGTISLSTWIQKLLNDKNFTLENFMSEGRQYKGGPIQAIINVGILNAIKGDVKWAEWLAKYGYGTTADFTSDGEKITFANIVPRPNV